ncbi:MAG TPA: hypothetical protein VEB86_07990 [Chryseosolibacter sp.]|nr:hypothetical protein [Chryseosolibacter sp.]
MKLSAKAAVAIVLLFVAAVFSIALGSTRNFPIYVIAGENSVATWLSGTLLTFMAALSVAIGMRSTWNPWTFFFGFFILLALDERFMFHENLKERIMFGSPDVSTWYFELPVILGSVAGLLMSYVLWRQLTHAGRVMLAFGVAFGSASVAIDIAAGGVIAEESFKLAAELLIVCALIYQLQHVPESPSS